MNRVLRYALIILVTLVAVAFLYQFRTVLVLLIISLALTTTTRPVVDYLEKRKIPGFLAQLMILTLIVGIITGLFILLGPTLSKELKNLVNFLFVQYNTVYHTWMEGEFWQQFFFSRLPEPGKLSDYLFGADGEFIVSTAISITQDLASFSSKLAMVLIFSLYWAKDHDQFKRRVLSFLPVQQRGRYRNIWQSIEMAIGTYVRSEILMGLVAVGLLYVGYSLIGLPYPITLALLGLVGWFIPLIGFAVILIPVFIIASSIGWGYASLSILLTILVYLGLKYWLEPKFLIKIRSSGFLIIFWIVVLGSFLGIGGFLAGPIVAVAIQAIWGQYLKYRTEKLYPDKDGLQINTLMERYATAIDHFNEIKTEYDSHQLENIFKRLEHSIKQADRIINAEYSG